jgi:hypothetical protein
MTPVAAQSPAPTTRTIGVVYLLYFMTALLAAFLMKGLVVPGDAQATSNGILGHLALYRSGLAVGLVSNLLYIAVTALLYGLFAPVDRTVSRMAAFIGLAGCTVQIVGGLFQAAPLVLLVDNRGLAEISTGQLQAATLLSLKLYGASFNVSFVLFALYDLSLGYLVVRSQFLPSALGALLMLAGLGWLTFLWPPLASAMSAVVLPIGALAELLLMGWLVVRAPR